MSKKPSTIAGWEKVCNNLNSALQLSIKEEEKLKKEIDLLSEETDDLWETVHGLEKQLNMSMGVIKYLEIQLDRANPV